MTSLSDYFFRPEDEGIYNDSLPPITIESATNHRPIVDRFFTRYYFIRQKAVEEPYQVLFHSNRICLVGLAAEHPAFAKGITEITSPILKKIESLADGEEKKRSSILQKDTTIAVVTCNDGTTYNIPCCVKGKMMEFNKHILQDPSILSKEGYGYIAILLPKIDECDNLKSSLMSHDEYCQQFKNKENV